MGKRALISCDSQLRPVAWPLPFVGREHLLNELSSDLKEGRNVIVLGPRGSGKSSLFRRLLDELPSSFFPIHIDGRAVPTLDALYDQAVRAALRQPTAGQRSAEKYTFLSRMGEGLCALHRSSKRSRRNLMLTPQLFSFTERLDSLLAPLASDLRIALASGKGLLAQVLQWHMNRSPTDFVLRLESLLRSLDATSDADFIERLLDNDDTLARLLGPLLRFRLGEVKAEELMRQLVNTILGIAGDSKPLLAIDEAHLLADESAIWVALRDVMLNQGDLSFVLCADAIRGELLSLVCETIQPKRHPFIQHVQAKSPLTVKYLPPLDAHETASLATNLLSAAGQASTDDALSQIHHLSGGMPCYVQSLCRLALEQARYQDEGRVGAASVAAAFSQLLQERDSELSALFEGLTPAQRALLLRTCSEAVWEERTLTADLDLERVQHAAVLEQLAQRLLISRVRDGVWQYDDPVFRAWLQRMSTS